MRFYITLLLAICFSESVNGQENQNIVTHIFQEGIISKGDYESHPAFSPTGDTLYFIKISNDLKISAICVSYLINKQWTAPQIASFSGKYMDADPFVAKDGKEIYFMSNRPLKEGGPVKEDTDIWKVVLTASGWSTPVRLDAPVNSEADEYYPTIADNGTIYFGSPRKGGIGGSDLYRCRLVKDKYLKAENLANAINTTGNEYEAFIAPDESYLIYNSTPGGLGNLDFYISYNTNGIWSKAKKLPAPLNSDGIEWAPKVTRNNKLFYFSSTRNRWATTPAKQENMQEFNLRLQGAGNSLGDIYTVDFQAISELK